MAKRPKRRKKSDNPYTLEFVESENKYKVSFKDGIGIIHDIEIGLDLYNLFDKFELEDLSEMNEFDNHIEHSEVFENNLHSRMLDKQISIEEIIEDKILNENLRKVIKSLPEIQQRRICMYFFEDMTLEEIAKKEKCSKVAIKYSIDIGIDNLRKKLKSL